VLTKLRAHGGLLRYLRNTIWLLSQRVLTMFVALLVSVWTARHLGPDQFGQIIFAYNFALLFVALAPLGLTRILDRDLVRDKSEIRVLMSSAFSLVILGAIVAYSAMLLVAHSRGYDKSSLRHIQIIGLLAFLQVNLTLVSYLLSQVQAKTLAIAAVIALSISNSAKVGFILTDAPLHYFAFGFVLDWLLQLPILLFVVKSSKAFPRLKYASIDKSIYLLKQSWPYILSGIMISLYMKIDAVMIKEILGDYAVGQYSAASRLSEGCYFIAIAIISSLYPAIVNAKQHSQARYENRLKNLYSLMFFLAVAMSIPVTIISPYAINVLYGEQFSEASGVLIIHIWASIFVFLGMTSGRWLLTEELQIISVFNTVVGAALNIGLNLIFIPKFGIEGAAWASIISYSVSGYFCFAIWKKTRTNFILMTKSFVHIPQLTR